MIILDTCALIFDALTPEKLPIAAKKAITHAEKKNQLYCCDISLWEVAMLIQKKRLEVDVDCTTFLKSVLQARSIQLLPINIEIAALSSSYTGYKHFDPANRLIAASAIYHRAGLITSDKQLQAISEVSIIWS